MIESHLAPDALCFTDAEFEASPFGYPDPLSPQPDGSITWEHGDQIYQWSGEVEGATWPGQTAQVIDAWDGFIGFFGGYDGGWVTWELPDPHGPYEYGAVAAGDQEPWWRFHPEDPGVYTTRITWGNVAGGEATDFIVHEERYTGHYYYENFVYVFADPGPGQVAEADATGVILPSEYDGIRPFVVGDIDGDGGGDLVSVYDPHPVFFSPLEGTRLADEPDAILDLIATAGGSARWSTHQAPFDIDGDGRDEMLAHATASSVEPDSLTALQIYSWDATGLVARGSVVFGEGVDAGTVTPLAADLDGDGAPDLVVPFTDGEAEYWAAMPYVEGVQEVTPSGFRSVRLPDGYLLVPYFPVPSMPLGDGVAGLLVQGTNAVCGGETPAYNIIDFASMLGVGS